jgi:hypothetical protein
MNLIANSSQAFITWDPAEGQWETVLNTTGSRVADFDDSNIVGSISVTGSGISDLYNRVRITFNNADMRGQPDERILSIPAADRFANELDNELALDFKIITDPVQAELLAAIELKQSRVDLIIQFTTDYTSIQRKPGELIGITNENYFVGSTANPKVFRIVSIEEIDGEDGGILLNFTCIEYDNAGYSTAGLTRQQRETVSDIVPASTNHCVIEKDVEATVDDLVTAIEQGNGINLSAASGYFTATAPQSASVSNYYTLNTITFTAPATATYVINTIFEQSTSGAEGGRGSTYSENEDYIAVIVDVINSSGTTIDTGGSGGPGAWYWTDLAVPQEVSLTAGESYSLQFLAANYTQSNPSASATFNVSYNVFTVR